MKMRSLFALSVIVAATSACSSTGPVKSQAYAKLKNEKTFEYELPIVYKGIEDAFHDYKIDERDPEEVDVLELKKLKHATWSTDWIYGRSRDKYQEYQVDGFPKKIYLQTRVKYDIAADQVIGGTHVGVETTEEIERLKDDGSSAGWDSAEPDPSRANEIIEKINQAILARHP